MDRQDILLSVFVAVEGAHAFSAFMPSAFTMKKFAEGDLDLKRLRSGYTPAVLFNITIGALVTVLIKSPLPLVLSILTIAAMIALYEQEIPKEGMNANEIQQEGI